MQEASAGQETQNAAGDAALRQLFVEYRLLNTLELFQRMAFVKLLIWSMLTSLSLRS